MDLLKEIDDQIEHKELDPDGINIADIKIDFNEDKNKDNGKGRNEDRNKNLGVRNDSK